MLLNLAVLLVFAGDPLAQQAPAGSVIAGHEVCSAILEREARAQNGNKQAYRIAGRPAGTFNGNGNC
jgi:hypothetical protein